MMIENREWKRKVIILEFEIIAILGGIFVLFGVKSFIQMFLKKRSVQSLFMQKLSAYLRHTMMGMKCIALL